MIQLEPLLGIEELSKQMGMNKFSIYHKIRNHYGSHPKEVYQYDYNY